MEFVFVNVARGANRARAYDPRTERTVLAVLPDGTLKGIRKAEKAWQAYHDEYLGDGRGYLKFPEKDVMEEGQANGGKVEKFKNYLTYYAAQALKWYESETILLAFYGPEELKGKEVLPEFMALPCQPVQAETARIGGISRLVAGFNVYVKDYGKDTAKAELYHDEIGDTEAVKLLRRAATSRETLTEEEKKQVCKYVWDLYIKPEVDNLAGAAEEKDLHFADITKIEEYGDFRIHAVQSGIKHTITIKHDLKGDPHEFDKTEEIPEELNGSMAFGYTGRMLELLRKMDAKPYYMTAKEKEELNALYYEQHTRCEVERHEWEDGTVTYIENYKCEVISATEDTQGMYRIGIQNARDRAEESRGKKEKEGRK